MQKIRLLKIWYGVIIMILAALLYEHTAKFDFGSIVFWLRLIFLLVAVLLTFYVIDDILMPVKTARRIEGIFAKQLKRKSDEIRRLKKEKDMFARSALKRAKEDAEEDKAGK